MDGNLLINYTHFKLKCDSSAIEFFYFKSRKQEIHIHFIINYPDYRMCSPIFGRFLFKLVSNLFILSANVLFVSAVNMHIARILSVAFLIPLVSLAHEPSRESPTAADYLVSKEDINRTLFS